jgi:hypothetical protein
MTVIYANSGDRDTVLLQAIWQGLHVDTYIEIGHDDYDYEDAVEAALINEDDTLILCGHGTSLGLLHPNWDSGQYIIHENNAHLIHAHTVIGHWCWAAEFAENNHLHGFFTGMFISNVGEAERFDIFDMHSDNDNIDIDIQQYETYFMVHTHTLLENHTPLNEWIGSFAGDGINFNNVIGSFNYNGLRYFD